MLGNCLSGRGSGVPPDMARSCPTRQRAGSILSTASLFAWPSVNAQTMAVVLCVCCCDCGAVLPPQLFVASAMLSQHRPWPSSPQSGLPALPAWILGLHATQDVVLLSQWIAKEADLAPEALDQQTIPSYMREARWPTHGPRGGGPRFPSAGTAIPQLSEAASGGPPI